MADLTITTNNVPRDLITVADLSEAERTYLDYIPEEEHFSPRIFRYRGEVYDVNEFVRIVPMGSKDPNAFVTRAPEGSPLLQWDGIQTDSYFSGVLVRWPLMFPEWPEKGHDYERVIVGRYYS